MRDLEITYPQTERWEDTGGMWLLVRSAVIDGLDRHATFLIGLPYAPGLGPRGWAYWTYSGQYSWMGRRHTNFPDGSICAFSPMEGVWSEGGNLVTLVDLYSVWALRQLHLELLGRWPGMQHSNSRFYRLMEFHDDELCSCEFGLRYVDCCKSRDRAAFLANPQQLKAEFEQVTSGCALDGRMPPHLISEFIGGRLTAPPPLAEALLH